MFARSFKAPPPPQEVPLPRCGRGGWGEGISPRCGRGDWGVHQNFPPPPPWLLSLLEVLTLEPEEDSFFSLVWRVTVV